MVHFLNARIVSSTVVLWSWWVSDREGVNTISGWILFRSRMRVSRISCRNLGNSRTSKLNKIGSGSPRILVAAFTSRERISEGYSGGMDFSQHERAVYVTSFPSSINFAIEPPHPNSPSSVCGLMTRIFFPMNLVHYNSINSNE